MTFEWSPQAKQAAVKAALASHNKGLDPYAFPANHRDYAQDVMAALVPYVQAAKAQALRDAAHEFRSAWVTTALLEAAERIENGQN